MKRALRTVFLKELRDALRDRRTAFMILVASILTGPVTMLLAAHFVSGLAEKAATLSGPSPLANMWCAHTPQPRNPMATPENTMNRYPNSGFRLNTAMTSLTMPKLGMIRM